MDKAAFTTLLAGIMSEQTKDISFYIFDQKLSKEQMSQLGCALKPNKSVQSIAILYDDQDAWIAITLAEVLLVNTSIKKLSLKTNNNGALAIAAALKGNKGLQQLALNESAIDNTGALQIAEALKVNQTLDTLSLTQNNIGNDGVLAIATAIKTNAKVQKLFLQDNIMYTNGRFVAEILKDYTFLTESSFDSGDVTFFNEALKRSNGERHALELIKRPEVWLNLHANRIAGIARRGFADVMQYMLTIPKFANVITLSDLNTAITYSQVKMFKLLLQQTGVKEKYLASPKDTLTIAARHDNVGEIFKILLALLPELKYEILVILAECLRVSLGKDNTGVIKSILEIPTVHLEKILNSFTTLMQSRFDNAYHIAPDTAGTYSNTIYILFTTEIGHEVLKANNFQLVKKLPAEFLTTQITLDRGDTTQSTVKEELAKTKSGREILVHLGVAAGANGNQIAKLRALQFSMRAPSAKQADDRQITLYADMRIKLPAFTETDEIEKLRYVSFEDADGKTQSYSLLPNMPNEAPLCIFSTFQQCFNPLAPAAAAASAVATTTTTATSPTATSDSPDAKRLQLG